MSSVTGLDLSGGSSVAAELGDGREVLLRAARASDRAILEQWDLEPDVVSATTDDSTATVAFDHHDWGAELAMQSDVYQYLIAEVGPVDQPGLGRPFGAMQVIDPCLEPTHYWGEIEPWQRAVDIWIGDPADRGQGLGTVMMQMVQMLCFADARVTAIIIDPLNSNTDAHRFYQRLGYAPTHRQIFNGEDDCLVHKLTRADWLARNSDDSNQGD